MSNKTGIEYALKPNASKPIFWMTLGGTILLAFVLPSFWAYIGDGHVPHLDHADVLLDLPCYFALGLQTVAWLGGLALGASGRKLPIAWGLFLGAPIAFLMLLTYVFLDHPLFGLATLLSG